MNDTSSNLPVYREEEGRPTELRVRPPSTPPVSFDTGRGILISRALARGDVIFYLAKEEVYQILATCTEKEKDEYLLISLLWKTGLRISEAILIRKKDINFYDKTMTVTWLKKRKAMRRSIPLQEDLSYDLSVYCSGKNEDDRLFPFSRQNAFLIVQKHVQKSGITKHVSPHTFRHSFAVHFLKETRNLAALQKLLGHAQITTTMVYLRLAHSDLKRELEQANF